MTRNSTFIGVVGAIALGIAAPAFADSQLAASAGLTDEEAAGMTLTELAQYKFNRDVSVADRWVPSIPPTNGSADPAYLATSAGIDDSAVDGMTLTEIAAVKFNHDTRADDHQSVMHASRVTIASRSVGDPPGLRPADRQRRPVALRGARHVADRNRGLQVRPRHAERRLNTGRQNTGRRAVRSGAHRPRSAFRASASPRELGQRCPTREPPEIAHPPERSWRAVKHWAPPHGHAYALCMRCA